MSLPLYRHVFYAGQLYETYTYEEWKGVVLPDGAFIRFSEQGNWYHYCWHTFVPLNNCDVPPELKTLCLLLGINL